jgi:hypothetical protein
MKADFSLKALGVFGLVVAGLYLGVFYGCESWRQRKGAWEVEFVSDAQGHPSLAIYQPRLGISSVEVLFLGETLARTNLSQKVVFDRPLQPIPFGRALYADLTTLPGVVTLDLFGHELELLPRVLIADKREIPWKSETVIELAATNKPPQPLQPPKGFVQP